MAPFSDHQAAERRRGGELAHSQTGGGRHAAGQRGNGLAHAQAR